MHRVGRRERQKGGGGEGGGSRDSRDSSWLDSPEVGEASPGGEAGMQIQLIQSIRFYLKPRVTRQRQKYCDALLFCLKIRFE